jgi:predicted chitinase
MLISPPFLLPNPGRSIDAAEAADPIVSDGNVCAVGMQECAPGNGAYPVSYSLGWHGGAHLIAPRDAQGQDVPTRAIADGTVVYARQNSGESEALLYRGVRTDDGCVVIKHETEIGDGDNAKVIFFSIYMHLQTVLPSITAGKKIYRKDTLGVAGEIYGQMGQMHFEIVCDSANLQKLVGRESGTLVAENGRTDAIYGDIWFTVPTGASIFANEPHPYRLDDEESAPGPSIRSQQPTFTTCDLVIRMRYELGNCTLTTFRQQDDGRYVEVGSPPSRDREYEYNLYKEATRLNARYAELGANFTVAPAPSAIYEMLRFGRIVGPDPLPVNGQFGHWREIKTPEGTGWTNLSSAAVGAFSDADFPHWAGWSLIDDDESTDSLCDSPTINRWLDLDGDGQVTHAEAVTALNSPIVRELMSKAICKFPIEWTKTDIDERWDWLMSPHEALPVPMWEVDFYTLKNHIEALAFWEEAMANEATLPGPSDCWHLPPTAFVEHFRKCGWLSANEMTRAFPQANMENVQRFQKSMNSVGAKYLSGQKVRLSHFFGQIAHETGDLTGPMVENGNSPLSRLYETDERYYVGPDSYPYMAKGGGYERLKNPLGNDYNTGDGIKFRGRGGLQITGRATYADYWMYRGWLKQPFDRHWWSKPGWWSTPRNPAIRPALIDDPQRISARHNGNEFNPIDVSGWFWATHRINTALSSESSNSADVPCSIRVSEIINRKDKTKVEARANRTKKAKDILCDAV